MNESAIIILIMGVIAFVFVMRLLGAWMLRINEVINELKKLNKHHGIAEDEPE